MKGSRQAWPDACSQLVRGRRGRVVWVDLRRRTVTRNAGTRWSNRTISEQGAEEMGARGAEDEDLVGLVEHERPHALEPEVARAHQV